MEGQDLLWQRVCACVRVKAREREKKDGAVEQRTGEKQIWQHIGQRSLQY